MKMKPCCKVWEERWQHHAWYMEDFQCCPWCCAKKDAVKKTEPFLKGVLNYEFRKPTEEEMKAGMIKGPGRYVNMAMQEARARSPKPPSGGRNRNNHKLWLIACRKAGYDYIGVPVGGFARKIGEVAP